MGLEVTKKSRNEALVSIEAVKVRLGIEDSSSDALLEALIRDASSKISAVLGCSTVTRQRYVETLPGRGRARLVLGRWPVDPYQMEVEVGGEAFDAFAVESAAAGVLYRTDGCPWPLCEPRLAADSASNVTVTYWAGWIAPGSVVTWSGSTALTLGQWVSPTDVWETPLLFEVTVPGTTAGPEPEWPTVAGETVESGTATLVARGAAELPAALADYTYLVVRDAFQSIDRETAVSSIKADGFEKSYFAAGVLRDTALPKLVESGLRYWARREF